MDVPQNTQSQNSADAAIRCTSSRNDAHRPVITIGLLDNDEFALVFLSRSIEELMPEAQVLWRTHSGREAVEYCLDPRHAPNLLLTDMSMEELSGVSVCRAIRARTNRVAILAVTSFSLRVYARKAAEAGAQGIVSKSMETPIIAAIRRVAAGEVWAEESPGVTFDSAVAAHNRLRHQPMPRQFLLSDREASAMNLCSRGLNSKQVASEMGIGVSTAKTYIQRSIKKLNASSRGEAPESER